MEASELILMLLLLGTTAAFFYMLIVVMPSLARTRFTIRLYDALRELDRLTESPRLAKQPRLLEVRQRILALMSTPTPIGARPLLRAYRSIMTGEAQSQMESMPKPEHLGLTTAERSTVARCNRVLVFELTRSAFLGSVVWPVLVPAWWMARWVLSGRRPVPNAAVVVDRTVSNHRDDFLHVR
ncbi:hypothetical protein WDZ16_12850 [Pseudokineococcus marinus]|uniref:Uncharacterized protein n=1 Tax=Pseudokineococcus marinus TaxID=351215 RepID=A0A849BK27_9ACTN|nr:hypothetical protein [Pseudokineococcus marinus]NNH21623.1 hypothetical protein [Pseudokineococcus marinus]